MVGTTPLSPTQRRCSATFYVSMPLRAHERGSKVAKAKTVHDSREWANGVPKWIADSATNQRGPSTSRLAPVSSGLGLKDYLAEGGGFEPPGLLGQGFSRASHSSALPSLRGSKGSAKSKTTDRVRPVGISDREFGDERTRSRCRRPAMPSSPARVMPVRVRLPPDTTRGT